jgi:hypothetical protein
MSQASKELRDYWEHETSWDTQAVNYLESRGFTITPEYDWLLPPGMSKEEMTPRDWSAIEYMADEWDYGGLAVGSAVETLP